VLMKNSLWLAIARLNLLHGLAHTRVCVRGKNEHKCDDDE